MQIKGRRLIEEILPAGVKGPNISIRARKDSKGTGISFVIKPHNSRAHTGEYEATIILPSTHGPRYDAALTRLKVVIARWMEIEAINKDIQEEFLACDVSEDGECIVENDMPIPIWRYHCPAPLRRAMDIEEMSNDRREACAEGYLALKIGEYKYDFKMFEENEQPDWDLRGRGCRTVSIVTIRSDKIYFSQGSTKCYLRIKSSIPDIVAAGLIGMPVTVLVDIPGLDIEGINILKCTTNAKNNETIVDLSRVMTMMAPMPR